MISRRKRQRNQVANKYLRTLLAAGRVAENLYWKYGGGSGTGNSTDNMPSNGKSSSQSDSRALSVSRGRTRGKRSLSVANSDYPMKGRILQRSLSRSLSVYRPTAAKGASFSKSRGFIKKGKKVYGPLDYYGTYGVVNCRELGGEFTTDGVEKAQGFQMLHATFGKRQLRTDLGLIIAKFVAGLIGRQIIQFSDSILETAIETGSPAMNINLTYKRAPADTNQGYIYNVTSSLQTWEGFANDFANFCAITLANQSNVQFIRLSVTKRDNATANTFYKVVERDLTRAKVKLYCKSSLKFQNRTVNTSGNVDADDVDNVPLFGKSYEGSGNFFEYQDTIISAGTTGDINLKLTKGLPNVGINEPLPLTYIKRAKALAKVHLDPGEIKTSVLVYQKMFTLDYLVRSILTSGIDNTNSVDSPIVIGKFRMIHLEKMLTAVATTSTNCVRIAYELDQKHGLVMMAPKVRQSNVIVNNSPQ